MNSAKNGSEGVIEWLDKEYLVNLRHFNELLHDYSEGKVDFHQEEPREVWVPWFPIKLDGAFACELHVDYGYKIWGNVPSMVEIVIDTRERRVVFSLVSCGFIQDFNHVERFDDAALQEVIEAHVGDDTWKTILENNLPGSFIESLKNSVASKVNFEIQVVKFVDLNHYKAIKDFFDTHYSLSNNRMSSVALLEWLELHSTSRKNNLLSWHGDERKLTGFFDRISLVLSPALINIIKPQIKSLFSYKKMVICVSGKKSLQLIELFKQKEDWMMEPACAGSLGIKAPEIEVSFKQHATLLMKKFRAGKVVLVTMDKLIDLFVNIEDNEIAGIREGQGLTLMEDFLSNLLLYFRKFSERWYAYPKPSTVRLLPRLLSRLFGLRLDLPRIWHDNAAKKIVTVMKNSFSSDERIILVKTSTPITQSKALLLTLKDYLPAKVEQVDFNLVVESFSQINDKEGLDFNEIFEKFKTSGNDVDHVVVISTGFFSQLQETFLDFFISHKPSLFSFQRLLRMVKNKGHFQVFPEIGVLSRITKMSSRTLIKKVINTLFLKY
ncbi:MAG: hypothetical protein ACTSVI_01910 [Promethearchaeota archaeon]